MKNDKRSIPVASNDLLRVSFFSDEYNYLKYYHAKHQYGKNYFKYNHNNGKSCYWLCIYYELINLIGVVENE